MKRPTYEDDEQPVTIEWVEGLGFKEFHFTSITDNRILHHPIGRRYGDSPMLVAHIGYLGTGAGEVNFSVGGQRLPRPDNKGEARDLFWSLGVETKEFLKPMLDSYADKSLLPQGGYINQWRKKNPSGGRDAD